MSIWYKLGGILLALAALIGMHLLLQKRAVNGALERQRAEYALKLSQAQEEAARKETKLRDSMIEALKEKDEQNKAIDNKLKSVSSSLQWYKKCASSKRDSSASSSGKACPGRELSREDAEFLAREAARADAVVAERNYYYGRYEEARKELASRKE